MHFYLLTFSLSTTMTPQVDPGGFQLAFDRVISIEMFEHMKNYQKLLHKVPGRDLVEPPGVHLGAARGEGVCPHIHPQVEALPLQGDLLVLHWESCLANYLNSHF